MVLNSSSDTDQTFGNLSLLLLLPDKFMSSYRDSGAACLQTQEDNVASVYIYVVFFSTTMARKTYAKHSEVGA